MKNISKQSQGTDDQNRNSYVMLLKLLQEIKLQFQNMTANKQMKERFLSIRAVTRT